MKIICEAYTFKFVKPVSLSTVNHDPPLYSEILYILSCRNRTRFNPGWQFSDEYVPVLFLIVCYQDLTRCIEQLGKDLLCLLAWIWFLFLWFLWGFVCWCAFRNNYNEGKCFKIFLFYYHSESKLLTLKVCFVNRVAFYPVIEKDDVLPLFLTNSVLWNADHYSFVHYHYCMQRFVEFLLCTWACFWKAPPNVRSNVPSTVKGDKST